MPATFPCEKKVLFDSSHWDFGAFVPAKRHLHVEVIRHTPEGRYSYVRACDGKYYMRSNVDTGIARTGELTRVHELDVFGPEIL